MLSVIYEEYHVVYSCLSIFFLLDAVIVLATNSTNSTITKTSLPYLSPRLSSVQVVRFITTVTFIRCRVIRFLLLSRQRQ